MTDAELKEIEKRIGFPHHESLPPHDSRLLCASLREERRVATDACNFNNLVIKQNTQLRKENAALRKAVTALSKVLHEINEDESHSAVFELAYVHGVVYTGPNYEKELTALDMVLAAGEAAK